ncbi:MAG: hypothetical protein M8841_02875 [marine benthic group bacterium]|jgi:hypothetical protein|nr:hypothetical protein [Gemmatimonadota bacterium]MCL7992221.1 hypothetical protein [Gemmatimonadota bacterium]
MQGETKAADPRPNSRTTGFDGTRATLLVVTIVLALAGARLLAMDGRSAITGGVLILIAALAAEAVALGSGAWGPGVEGDLDLSSRLGLGVLGGILAALVHGLLTLLAGWTGIAALLAPGLEIQLSAADWGVRVLHGVAWGFLLGFTWRWLPGSDFVTKGLLASVILSLYVLLVRYPFFESAGFLGIEFGALTPLLVVFGNALVAVVAAGVIAWGARSPDRPVSQPLVTGTAATR